MKEIILHAPNNLAFSRYIIKHLPTAIRNKLPAEIAIVAVSEKKSLALNRQYRKKRTPANVLSFLYDKEYGEIIVCPAVIRREARAQKHSYQYQMTWMVAHGMMHLAGMHHEESLGMQARFENIEQRVLKRITNYELRIKQNT